MAAAMEIVERTSGAALVRPEHLAALVEPVLQKLQTTAVGVRATGQWKGEEIVVGGIHHPVVYCASVLAVREALDRHSASQGPALILLTPLSDDELGWDVLIRLAKRRLLEMTPWDIVRDLFHARSVDPRITPQSWMAQALLEGIPSQGYPPVASGVLDIDTAWSHLLDRALGLHTGRPDAEALLEASLNAAFGQRYSQLPEEISAALPGRVEETAGRLGVLLVNALAAGHGQRLVAIGLTCDVLFPDGRSGGLELERAAVRLETYVGGRTIDPALGLRWADAARRVLDRSPDLVCSRVYQQTEELLAELRADSFVGLSTVLPSGYLRRVEGLGRAITSFLSQEADAIAVEEAATWITQHRMATFNDEAERLERLQMAVRLVRYLQHRKQSGHVTVRSIADAAELYTAESSYVDWARTSLLGGEQEPGLAMAVNDLIKRVREVREQENRVFAERLAEWNRSPGADRVVVPVEHLLDEFVVSAVTKSPVLLLVLDGMSFANFRQLFQQLSRKGWEQWVPEARSAPIVGLAVSPSITRLSRTTLFTGKVANGVSADEKRAFRQHPGLMSKSKSKKLPQLFHKGDLTQGATSGLADSVREAIRDVDQKVVGIVLNVLDDSLAKSDQVIPRWTLDRIRLLEPILYEARIAGRLVILASDHGHVLEAEGTLLPGNTEERWRTFSESVDQKEIALAGPRIEVATGERQIVVPWSEQVRYVRKKAGYHGGASPQEMLIPVSVLAPSDRALDGWSRLIEQPPSWWAAAEKAAALEVAPTRKTTTPARSRSTEGRESLFDTSPADDIKPQRQDWIARLMNSTAFASQRTMTGRTAPPDADVRIVLELLESHQGRVSQSMLSQSLNVPETHLRRTLPGLQRLLNLDGYPIVSVDEASDSVEVDLGLLRKQFQVEM